MEITIFIMEIKDWNFKLKVQISWSGFIKKIENRTMFWLKGFNDLNCNSTKQKEKNTFTCMVFKKTKVSKY